MADKGFLTKEKLTAICDSIRAKTGSTGLIPIDDIPQAITNIQTGGGIIEVDELPELWESTVVPNGGLIENLYFNTELSINDVVNLVKKNLHYLYTNDFGLTYSFITEKDDDTINSYVIMFDFDKEMVIIGNSGISYGTDTAICLFSTHKIPDSNIDFYGWNPNISYPISINLEMKESSYSHNELFKDLVSTTAFVKTNNDIKENTLYKINPVAIPNSGIIEKIYFNTNINNEQYHNILSNVTFTPASAIGASGWSFYAVMAYLVDSVPYVLAFKKFSDDNIDLALVNFSTMSTIQNFYDGGGGVYDFENPYYIGYSVLSTLSGLPIGNQNEVIKEILSLKSFDFNILQDEQFIELVKKY